MLISREAVLALMPYQTLTKISGITNNLLSASNLVDAGCEIFCHHTGCEVTHNGEIILRGWRDPATRLWRVSLKPEGGNNIVPASKLQNSKRLAKAGYYQCQYTPELWQHVWRPITFCFVVTILESKQSD